MGACCTLSRELADQFATAARLWAEAVVTLTAAAPRISRADYYQLRSDAAKAQMLAETARIAFEEHVNEHGCEGSADPAPAATRKELTNSKGCEATSGFEDFA